MPRITWSDKFEKTPSINDERKYGAQLIRELKEAIEEREELEHNFVDGTSPFHKAGLCPVVLLGTETEIDNFEDMTAGCLAFDTDKEVYKIYVGAAWVAVASGSHSDLEGLSDEEEEYWIDDHPQYLNLYKPNQTLEESLDVDTGITIDGVDIGTLYASLDSLIDTIVTGVYSFSGAVIEGSGAALTSFAVGDVIWTTSPLNPGPFVVKSRTSTTLTLKDGTSLSSQTSIACALFTTRGHLGDWEGTYAENGWIVAEVEDRGYRHSIDRSVGNAPTTAFMYTKDSEGNSFIASSILCGYYHYEYGFGDN